MSKLKQEQEFVKRLAIGRGAVTLNPLDEQSQFEDVEKRDERGSMSKNSRLVYSTDTGRIKEEPAAPARPAGDGIVRLHRETKGRKGKGVTVVAGLPLQEADLKALAKQLKQLCGTGGSVKNGHIEIQGEQRDKLKPYLEKEGFTVKIAGG